MIEKGNIKAELQEAITLEQQFLRFPDQFQKALETNALWDSDKKVLRDPHNLHRFVKPYSTKDNYGKEMREIRLCDNQNGFSLTLMEILAREYDRGWNWRDWRYSVIVDSWGIESQKHSEGYTAFLHQYSYTFPGKANLHNDAGFAYRVSKVRTRLEEELEKDFGEITPYYNAENLPLAINGWKTMRVFFQYLARQDFSCPPLVPND